ncbi:hypothetical protein BD413DRAFT_598300 [Trametes elegans]|nr:hypothetical protein BD413DRAFT_598300 [Trametes elegans]
MTLNILVSFSLLALVVTARPISDAPQSVKKSLKVQNAIQAIFESRTGERPDCLSCNGEDGVHITVISPEEQLAALSRLQDIDAIKAVLPLNLDDTPTEDEQQLYDILKDLKSTESNLEDVDGGLRPLPEASLTAMEAHADPENTTDESDYPTVGIPDIPASPPLIVLAISSVAALLALLCISAGLYALNHVRSFFLNSALAWDVLPRLERRIGLDGPDHLNVDGGSGGGGDTLPEKHTLLRPGCLLPLPPLPAEKDPDEKHNFVEPSTDEGDDIDEKFEDAPEHSLLFLDTDLSPKYDTAFEVPQIIIDDAHDDPDLLPLPDMPTAQPTPFSTPLRTPLVSPVRSPARRVPQMRERQPSPTPASKPLWSLRAADAPALGLFGNPSPSSSPLPTSLPLRAGSPTPQVPGALFADDAPELMVEVPRARARRGTTPRQPLDIAFALQLRPGLGLGADSAWIVRFLMTMFGWMTVLIGGGSARQESTRRALTA